MEVRVGAFKADILAKEAGTGQYVLIENQLERTNHDHLGKVVPYASGLGATAVVWVAKEITEEHRRAVDWLNEVTTDAVGFFALEVELWRIGDSPPAPKFNLVSQPNEWANVVSGGRTTAGWLSSSHQICQHPFRITAATSRARAANVVLSRATSMPHRGTFII
jgi:hypothetical protein